MEVSYKFIGMVKTNNKRFCTDTIEKLTKDWPGDSYLGLSKKPMRPSVRPLLSIGYTYNVWKIISFIVVFNTGGKQAGLCYLAKYH